MFATYDPNHHILHTYLCRIFITAFGLSELSLRLASLAGGAFYLGMVIVLCRYALGEGWLFLLTASFLSLHPLVLDFLSAARGYGLALAFFLFGLYHLLRALDDDPGKRPLWLASLGMGLSLASNYSVAYAVGAVSLLFFAAIAALGGRQGHPRLGATLLYYALPAAAIDLILMLAPLLTAQRDQFGTDAKSFLEMLRSLARISYAKVAARPGMLLASESLRDAVVVAMVVAPMAAAAWFGLRVYRQWRAEPPAGRADALLWLTGGGIPVAALAILAVHGVTGFDYPEGRTALFWIPLWGLSAGALAAKLPRAGAGIVTGFLALSCAQFAVQFETSEYFTWPYDRSTKELAAWIGEHHGGHTPKQVRVGASQELEPSLNFYRIRNGQDWMEPVPAVGPAGRFDYYLLLPRDQGILKQEDLLPLRKDPFTGVVLAVPRR